MSHGPEMLPRRSSAAGVVVSDTVVAGSHGVAGAIGHLTVNVSGPPCRRGGRGCDAPTTPDPTISARIAEATRMPAADDIDGEPHRFAAHRYLGRKVSGR